MLIDIIGYTAGVLTLVLMLPQIIKSYKRKSVDDVSFFMVLFFGIAVLLWAVYGYLINSMPLLITDAVAVLLTAIQIGLMVKYRK
ncbi:hypothetical protein KY330_00040 [Candidatus Woesearchaeota archaeon]|nr:hypothetical protein [Candidatus Woesearchaeota archaeon]